MAVKSVVSQRTNDSTESDFLRRLKTLRGDYDDLYVEHSELTESHEELTESHNILTVAHNALKKRVDKMQIILNKLCEFTGYDELTNATDEAVDDEVPDEVANEVANEVADDEAVVASDALETIDLTNEPTPMYDDNASWNLGAIASSWPRAETWAHDDFPHNNPPHSDPHVGEIESAKWCIATKGFVNNYSFGMEFPSKDEALRAARMWASSPAGGSCNSEAIAESEVAFNRPCCGAGDRHVVYRDGDKEILVIQK